MGGLTLRQPLTGWYCSRIPLGCQIVVSQSVMIQSENQLYPPQIPRSLTRLRSPRASRFLQAARTMVGHSACITISPVRYYHKARIYLHNRAVDGYRTLVPGKFRPTSELWGPIPGPARGQLRWGGRPEKPDRLGRRSRQRWPRAPGPPSPARQSGAVSACNASSVTGEHEILELTWSIGKPS